MLESEIKSKAGIVWKALSCNGELSLAQLSSMTGITKEYALLAIGWLFRDKKIDFLEKGGVMYIVLLSLPSEWYY